MGRENMSWKAHENVLKVSDYWICHENMLVMKYVRKIYLAPWWKSCEKLLIFSRRRENSMMKTA